MPAPDIVYTNPTFLTNMPIVAGLNTPTPYNLYINSMIGIATTLSLPQVYKTIQEASVQSTITPRVFPSIFVRNI